MRPSLPTSRAPRRGLTLVEMLVTVALLILMMTVVTSIFQAATGAITVAKAYQELDGQLRQLDSVLRTDLLGATVDTGTGPIVPPIDPDLNLGYLEIGENQFADRQGEDSDDYLRFTAEAPEGQLFTGRMWIGPMFQDLNNTRPNQPVMIQSRYAEIIYFLRNGNLYRRVFLVSPELQGAVRIAGTGSSWQLPATAFGWSTSNAVYGSWQGMNDLSARPATVVGAAPILNTLGDLTNRENRAFYPRFSNDYLTNRGPTIAASGGPDGQWDDINVSNLGANSTPIQNAMPGDSVPDWWPTLYPSVFNTNLGLINPTVDANGVALFYFARYPNTSTNADNPDLMSFPYIFPGAFSVYDSFPSGTPSLAAGVLHGMGTTTGVPIINGTATTLAAPSPYGYVAANGIALNAGSPNAVNQPNHNPIATGDTLTVPDPVNGPLQTWWGFPTWKETMSPSWADPVFTLASGSGAQATGLSWANQSTGLLPPLNDLTLDLQPFNDGAGTATFVTSSVVFRDDIIMQGVRSFDVKVYDNAVPGYVDLGYASIPATTSVPAAVYQTMGHEGRIPPLTTDNRSDPNYPNWLPNIGDDTATVIRLRRVWDSWSTDYSNAPANALVRLPAAGNPPVAGPPMSQPVYPSYPAPYPAPLRGIQVQIRVTDPRNERIKVLTIRHSFAS
jgi:type II secretory pathway pseudopilin PulG